MGNGYLFGKSTGRRGKDIKFSKPVPQTAATIKRLNEQIEAEKARGRAEAAAWFKERFGK
jgi:hypothetical protein